MSGISEPFYISPIYETDPATGSLVQEYRDSHTGARLYQVPSEAQLLTQAVQTSTATPAPTSQTSAPTAPHPAFYPSPEIEIDGADGQVILQYRDEATGKVQYELPSAAEIALYQQTQARHLASDEPPKSDLAPGKIAS